MVILSGRLVKHVKQILDDVYAIAPRLGVKGIACVVIAVGFGLFHLYTSATYAFDPYIQRAGHLVFILVLIFLTYPPPKPGRKWRIFDIVLALAAASICVYVAFHYLEFRIRAGIPQGIEPLLSALLIVLILEATRRTCGIALPIVAVLALVYAFFGYLLPGALSFSQFSLQHILAFEFNSSCGIWGIPLGVSSTLIAIFVIFGAFLTKVGVMDVFAQMAYGLAGRRTGGPGLVAVVSSGFVGMITGSSSANVYITGQNTIPLMKRSGFKTEFAAAVEAAASTGGIIMPPIMGAGAFIMAEFLDISYFKIMVAAFIPGVLYFLSVGTSVYLQASKKGIKPVPPDVELPKVMQVFLRSGYKLVPLLVMLATISFGFSAVKSAFYAIVMVFLLSMVRKETRLGVKRLIETLEQGARGMLVIGSACACAGIVLGVVAMTGLGVKLSLVIFSVGSQHLLLALLLAMVVAIILGMGLPATAAYVLAAATTTVGLIMLGIPPLVAHMFVFYFSCFGVVTPPLCITIYAAANVANIAWLRIVPDTLRLVFPAFILAYMYLYNNALLLMGSWWEILLAAIIAAVGLLMFAFAFQGRVRQNIKIVDRILLSFGGLLLVTGTILPYTIVGLTLGSIALLRQKVRKNGRT